MFVDSHCHILKEYYDDIDKVIDESRDNGVKYLISCGCSTKDIIESLEYAKKYEHLFLSIGYHPDCIDDYDLEFLKDNLKNTKVIALGEIGLDYHYINSDTDKERQRKLFIRQLDIAEKENIPVIIHSREATNDILEILKRYNLKGIIHCFSDDLESARKYIDLGYKLGIGGILTFNNSNLKDVVSKISLDDIVLETDSPYLAPTPYRGNQNSPKFIPLIATEIANIKDVSIEEVMNKTTANINKLFNLF